MYGRCTRKFATIFLVRKSGQFSRVLDTRYEMRLFYFLQKVKELTYMHSEGIMAGELKHGPLALVDDSMPVIMIVMRDPVYVVSMLLI